jgi:hypothetical protein
MPGWWSANHFRRARIALIGVSMASCAPHFTGDSLLGMMPVVFLHLGLLLSLHLERRGWLARTVGTVLLLPSSIVSALMAGLVLAPGADGRTDPLVVTTVVAFALAHAIQLWRLAGLPIPPLHPLAVPVTHGAGGRDWHPVQGG